MKSRYKINGIRLNKNLVQVTPKTSGSPDQLPVLFCRTLASNKINMVFMVLNTIENQSVTSGTVALKDFDPMVFTADAWEPPLDVCMVSIYPHHYQLDLIGHLFALLGQNKIPFLHLASSNAMLTFVAEIPYRDMLLNMLSTCFDLPDSHAPFDQEENQALTEFLKSRYPETRATYVEERIKTYGISRTDGLRLDNPVFSFNEMDRFGKMLESMTKENRRFFHISAHMDDAGRAHLFLLTQKGVGQWSSGHQAVDLISFQGPHFGDRHSIISRALDCFSEPAIPVVLAGCTGASIHIVVPEGVGVQAGQALGGAFEIPA